jgi:large subunit ribosomal protein L17
MRHQNSGRRLGVGSALRLSMMRNMVTDLMRYGRIQTTLARAKELRKFAERVITLSRRVTPAQLELLSGDALVAAKATRLHAIRQARLMIEDRDVLQKLFSEYSTRYATRPGGYTRILKLGNRHGDQAKVVLIELVLDAEAPAEAAAEAPAEAAAEAPAEAAGVPVVDAPPSEG